MKKEKIVIIGAGPGGLTAGMILSSKGYDVEIYEKNKEVGGRNGAIVKDGFKFDIGPTFLMLKPILDEVFEEAGEDINKYLKFYDLEPMYELVFNNKRFQITSDHQKMRENIAKSFPGEEVGFDKLLKREKVRFERAYPCLQKDYSKFHKLFNKDIVKFVPHISYPDSMHDQLSKYFKSEDLKMAFTFQSKYLGMSPWDCPAAFMIIPYVEHNFGIQHVRGGLSEISIAMKKVILKNGGKIILNTPVKEIKEDYIVLENGNKVFGDRIILNADIGYAMDSLVKTKEKEDLSKKDYSCSTFMLYLGLSKKVDLEHHTIFFSDDYKKYVDSVFKTKNINNDVSFYIRNGSKYDSTIAPKGKTNLYVLVPVPNNSSKINWAKEKKIFRRNVLDKMKEKTGIDFEKLIISETVITPKDWEEKYNVYLGATFNLAHSLGQMLYFRPHNQLSDKLYLVGGGTHPGSGLPTIYESGRITSALIMKKNK